MLVADRHRTLVAKGRTVETIHDAIDHGEPHKYEENDDLVANILFDDGWYAVVGDRPRIAGYNQCAGRVLSSVEEFERVAEDRGGVKAVRSDDEHVAYVQFFGGRFHSEYLIVGNRKAIWRAAVEAIRARYDEE